MKIVNYLKEAIDIEINDASGKVVKRMRSNASNRYSVGDPGKGIYFIKILDKEITTVSKLIFQ